MVQAMIPLIKRKRNKQAFFCYFIALFLFYGIDYSVAQIAPINHPFLPRINVRGDYNTVQNGNNNSATVIQTLQLFGAPTVTITKLEDSIYYKRIKEVDYLIKENKQIESIAKLRSIEESLNDVFSNIYLYKGYCYSILSKYDSALIYLNRVIEIDSTNSRAWQYKGKIYQGSDEFRKAEWCFTKAYTLNPKSIDIILDLAWCLAAQSKNNLSIKYYSFANSADTNKLKKLLSEALIYHLKRDYIRANISYEKALKEDKRNTFLLLNKGIICQNLKRYNEAEVCFMKLLEKDSLVHNGWHYLGYNYVLKKQLDSALYCYNKIISMNPQNVNAWYSLANVWYQKGRIGEMNICYGTALSYEKRPWARAIRYIYLQKDSKSMQGLMDSIRLDSSNALAWNSIGSIYLSSNKLDSAILFLKRSIKCDSTNIYAWKNMHDCYQRKNDKISSLWCINKITSIDSTDIEAILVNARIKFENKDFSSALTYFNQALKIDSEHPSALFHRAYIYSDFGILDSALIQFKRALAVDSSNVNIWHNLGAIYNKLGEENEATKCFGKTIRLDTINVFGHINKADILFKSCYYTGAIISYKYALKLEPRNLYLLDKLGAAYSNMGEYEKALEYCEKAISLDSSYLFPYYHASYIYLKTGFPNKAIKLNNIALRFNPDKFGWADIWFYNGCAYNQLNNPNEANAAFSKVIDFYEKITITDSLNSSAWYKMGNCYLLMNMLREAMFCYNKTISIKLHHYQAWFHRTQIFINPDWDQSTNKSYEFPIEVYDDLDGFYPKNFKVSKKKFHDFIKSKKSEHYWRSHEITTSKYSHVAHGEFNDYECESQKTGEFFVNNPGQQDLLITFFSFKNRTEKELNIPLDRGKCLGWVFKAKIKAGESVYITNVKRGEIGSITNFIYKQKPKGIVINKSIELESCQVQVINFWPEH